MSTEEKTPDVAKLVERFKRVAEMVRGDDAFVALVLDDGAAALAAQSAEIARLKALSEGARPLTLTPEAVEAVAAHASRFHRATVAAMVRAQHIEITRLQALLKEAGPILDQFGAVATEIDQTDGDHREPDDPQWDSPVSLSVGWATLDDVIYDWFASARSLSDRIRGV